MRMAYLAKVAFEVCSLLHLLNCLPLRAQFGKWGRDFPGSRKAHSWFLSSQKEVLGGLSMWLEYLLSEHAQSPGVHLQHSTDQMWYHRCGTEHYWNPNTITPALGRWR